MNSIILSHLLSHDDDGDDDDNDDEEEENDDDGDDDDYDVQAKCFKPPSSWIKEILILWTAVVHILI